MSTLRKILTTGVGAALMTEEGVREYLGRIFDREMKGFLARIDIPNNLRKALAGMTLEIQAKIKISDPKKHK
jgi:hypothetical protein